MPTIVSPEIIAYLAGFFDGEGCIHLTERRSYWLYKGKKTPYIGFFASVKVTQNVRRPLELFQEVFGGNIRIKRHPGSGGGNWVHYEWECSRGMMVKMLESLQPFLIVKKREAECAIRFVASLQRGVRITEEKRAMRRAMIIEVKDSKRLGRVLVEERVA